MNCFHGCDFCEYNQSCNGRCLTTPFDSAGSREIPNNNKFTLRWINSSKVFTIVIMTFNFKIIQFRREFVVFNKSLKGRLSLTQYFFGLAENYPSSTAYNCLAQNWLSKKYFSRAEFSKFGGVGTFFVMGKS